MKMLAFTSLSLMIGAVSIVDAQSYHVVNFQAQSGHYVVAENGGNSYMNADRGSAGAWETFELQDTNGGNLESGDEVYIYTSGGYYASQHCLWSFPYTPYRQGALGTSLNCSTQVYIDKYDNNNNWISGQISSGDQVVIIGFLGIWQAENGGGTKLFVKGGGVGAWEKFFITIH